MADVKELNINNQTYDIKGKTVVDNNNGELSFWSGTRAEYDAIPNKNPKTLYSINDDTDVTFALLELLFPIGAVYLGTMSVCPLQTLGIGTWQALPQDKVIQIAGTRGSVGDTLNESLPNITGKFITRIASEYSAIDSIITGVDNVFSEELLSGYGSVNANTNGTHIVSFNAHDYSSTYQDNAPVQQDAYLLNGWRRIA